MKKEILLRFFKSECSNNEIAEVIQWLHSDKYDSQLREMIDIDLEEMFSEKSNDKRDLDHLMPKIYSAVSKSKAEENNKLNYEKKSFIETTKASKRKGMSLLKWAASVMLVAIFSFIIYTSIQKRNIKKGQSQVVAHLVTKSNGFGRKSTIFLKDGTVIYLDSDSKISYPSVFSGSIRQVTLVGEAYFDVAHDEAKPFIVKTGPVNIKVLGTEFNVRAFSETDEVKVSLKRGQVEVSNEINETGYSEKLLLSSGQSVIFDLGKGNFYEVKSFNTVEDCGWKDGIIFFEKARFHSVINKLEKWYNVHIEVVNKPTCVWSYSGKFKDQNLDNVLRSIGFSQGFSYKIENEKVFIKFKNQ